MPDYQPSALATLFSQQNSVRHHFIEATQTGRSDSILRTSSENGNQYRPSSRALEIFLIIAARSKHRLI
jgi:hypothetical protein